MKSGFLANVRLHPDAFALSIGARRWTYAEASEIAHRWAARLIDACGGVPKRVGVFGYRSETSYLGVLATLLAGATFVPLNRKFPVERTRSMIEQADLDALLVDGGSLPQLEGVLRGLPRAPAVLLTDADADMARVPVMFDRTSMANASPLAELPSVSPDDVAYLLFTSGSTGRPKGVPVTHSNVTAFLGFNQRRYGLTVSDRLSQTFDQTFDLSIFDIFMAWGCGACVCVLQPIDLTAPFRFLETNNVTVWFSVPSVAALLRRQNLLRPGSLPTLRWSLFCGEGLPRATAEAWQAAAPNSVVENLYGPTELTIACSVYRWRGNASVDDCIQELVPIGRVYDGLSALVVDHRLDPVPTGDVGELCVAGPQTFPGYWRAPELTAERVFERPGPSGERLRYYRTGDMVRTLPSGEFVYLGRSDQQVKIGGYRIELGEIEAALRREGCTEAAALAWPSAQEPEAIVAFVSGAVELTSLQDALRKNLPGYMVPRSIHSVEPMPLNANGKVNRDALRQRMQARDRTAVAPTFITRGIE